VNVIDDKYFMVLSKNDGIIIVEETELKQNMFTAIKAPYIQSKTKREEKNSGGLPKTNLSEKQEKSHIKLNIKTDNKLPTSMAAAIFILTTIRLEKW